ncbi:MAG: hypothetical protein A2749_00955 [Parcubacteria group bacterium RIFCSPHIGHO2_01_FULL_45_26]|nr:MAG: hypothetical protein A2749_00955 [Parcubacteria group bacterium RIFCSPHIGHO2_01_FULL_45_26]
MNEMSERKVYGIAVGFRILLFCLILLTVGSYTITNFGDAPDYYGMAGYLIKHHSLTTLYYPLLESARPPGYSVFLLPFLSLNLPIWLASLVQIVFVSFIPIIAMRIAWLLGLNEKVRKYTGLTLALEPLGAFYSIIFLSDTFAALIFIIGVYLLLKFWQNRDIKLLAFSALAFGLLNYIRPIGMFLYILIPTCLLVAGAMWDRLNLKKYLIYGLIFAGLFNLVLLPWRLRNMKEFGVFGFVSGIERQLYDITAAGVRSSAESMPYPVMQLQMRDEVRPLLREPRDMASFYNHGVLISPALEIIKMYPLHYVKNYIRGLATFFGSGNYQYPLFIYNIIDSHFAYLFISVFSRLLWTLIFGLSLLGAYKAWRQVPSARVAVLLYTFFILYSMALVANMTVGVEARHRLFLHPFYFIFATYVYVIFLEWRKKSQTKKLS